MATHSKSLNGKESDISVHDLSEQIKVLKSDISLLTSALGDYGKAKSAEASATATDAARDLADRGIHKAVETQKQAEDFIKTQPATALGIAAGVGFLVGLVTARR